MRILGANAFDQCVLNMALIHVCNQEGYIGQQLYALYNAEEIAIDLWSRSHWFNIYVPHPAQEFEEISLEQGLTRGYNVEVKAIGDLSQIPYPLLKEAHFVTVLKQKGLNQNYHLAATGIFIRPLAAIKLDIIDDIDNATYQPVLIKHPVMRDYPANWEQKLWQYLNQEIRSDALPDLVKYVDQAHNRDYRSPTWSEVRLAATGFVGV